MESAFHQSFGRDLKEAEVELRVFGAYTVRSGATSIWQTETLCISTKHGLFITKHSNLWGYKFREWRYVPPFGWPESLLDNRVEVRFSPIRKSPEPRPRSSRDIFHWYSFCLSSNNISLVGGQADKKHITRISKFELTLPIIPSKQRSNWVDWVWLILQTEENGSHFRKWTNVELFTQGEWRLTPGWKSHATLWIN